MKRRDFFATTAATTGLGVGLTARAVGADGTPGREWYVLNRFFFASEEKLEAFASFLNLAVPAFNRAGAKPVGAFRLLQDDNPKLSELDGNPNELWLLLPHEQALEVWPASGQPQRLDGCERLEAGPEFPGLQLELAEIWEG